MSEPLTEGWQIFIEQYPQFTRLMNRLAKTDWFKNDGWALYTGKYHAGIFFQLYKPHWHNYNLNGVHIEAGLDAEALESKKLRIDLHIGHANLFDRKRFNELTLPSIKKLVAGWGDGYALSEKNLSDRLHTVIPFTKTRFAEQVAAELTRWSDLGAIIDRGFRKLE